MGTYMIGNEEILDVLEGALNYLEGDFTDKQLKDCLDITKAYPYVCDKIKSVDAYRKLKGELKR